MTGGEDMEEASADLNRRQFLAGAVAGSTLLATGTMGAPSLLHAASEDMVQPEPRRNKDLLYKTPWGTTGDSETAPFSLPSLPYTQNALVPYISADTMEFHYGKHHQGYINKTNTLIEKTEYSSHTLEQIVHQTAGKKDSGRKAIFNNAAQAWNHAFYWQSMTPEGGGTPTGDLFKKIESDFGSFENFRTAFRTAAASQFGSGWAWLALDRGALTVEKTSNADTPLAYGRIPLLTLDVWEHAYYLDYRNRRTDYIAAWLDHLVNWEFAAENFSIAAG